MHWKYYELLSFESLPHNLLPGIGNSCFISKEISKRIFPSTGSGKEKTLEGSLKIRGGGGPCKVGFS